MIKTKLAEKIKSHLTREVKIPMWGAYYVFVQLFLFIGIATHFHGWKGAVVVLLLFLGLSYFQIAVNQSKSNMPHP